MTLMCLDICSVCLGSYSALYDTSPHRVHPLEVVIHHELQHVVGVTLVGLQQPVHHGPALQ